MRKFFKLSCFGLFVAIIFTFAACGGSKYDERVKYDEAALQEFIDTFDKKYPFGDDKILVTLTDEAREHIDEYTVEDFSQINPASIKKLLDFMIVITLTETGRENVLRAVYILNLRTDVESASPNYIDHGCV